MSSSEKTTQNEKYMLELLTQCYAFCSQKHKFQQRKSDGSSYIIHPNGVAEMIVDIGKCFDVEIVCGGILHDTVEDTDCTEKELREVFGNRIANYVMEVTDDKSMDKVERKKRQIDHCDGISPGGQTIKLADKLNNLTDLAQKPPKGWSVERCQGYFLWAKTIVDKIKGANKNLSDAIYKLMNGNFNHSGKQYPCIDANMVLDDYYKLLKESNEK